MSHYSCPRIVLKAASVVLFQRWCSRLADETGWAENKHLWMSFWGRENGTYTCSWWQNKRPRGKINRKENTVGLDEWVGEKKMEVKGKQAWCVTDAPVQEKSGWFEWVCLLRDTLEAGVGSQEVGWKAGVTSIPRSFINTWPVGGSVSKL